jgi:DNA invertase Pin-like site-specific DNA recombinase
MQKVQKMYAILQYMRKGRPRKEFEKLDYQRRDMIFDLIASGMMYSDIAYIFNVDPSQITRIVNKNK